MKKLLLTLAVLCGTVSGWAQSATMPLVSGEPSSAGWNSKTYWYTIKTGEGHYLASTVADGDGNLKLTNKTSSREADYLWCIVGSDETGYKFYNKAKGTAFVLTTTGSEGDARTNFVNTAEGTDFYFAESAKKGYWCVRKGKDGNNYWNRRGDYLAFWNSEQAIYGWGHSASNPGNGDNGSALMFEIVPEEIVSVDDLDNTFTYYLRSQRGALVYNTENPNQLSSTTAYSNISNESPAAEWVIYKHEGKYYFYSPAAKKFVCMNKSDGGKFPFNSFPVDDVQIVGSTLEGYPFLFSTDGNGAINHFSHSTAPGVANWKSNGTQGGLLSKNDEGSAHKIFRYRPLTATEKEELTQAFTTLADNIPTSNVGYVLYDAEHKVFLDIHNLGTAEQQTECTELATLKSEKPAPLYIDVTESSWSIHTTAEGGKYLGQYTGKNQWNSKVNEELSDFAWRAYPIKNGNDIYFTLRHFSGTNEGYLGNATHADGSVTYANISAEGEILKFKLHEANLAYKVVLNQPSAVGTVQYNGRRYVNGDYIFADSEITEGDLSLVNVIGYSNTIALDNNTKVITATYTEKFNPDGLKVLLKNKQHNRFLGVNFVGGELDNAPVPTTHKFSGNSESDYRNCWELQLTTYGSNGSSLPCFVLYNSYYDWYAGKIAGRNTPIDVVKSIDDAGRFDVDCVEETVDNETVKVLTFRCLNKTTTNEYWYLHMVDWSNYGVVDWNYDAAASKWYMTEVTDEMIADWNDQVKLDMALFKEYCDAMVRPGIGYYSGLTDEQINIIKNIEVGDEDIDIIKARECLYAMHYQTLLVLNPPTVGFYYIKSMNSEDSNKNGKYIQLKADLSGMEEVAEATSKSIIYINENNNLLHYTIGRYQNGYAAPAVVGSTADTWQISENPKVKGAYSLKSSSVSNWLSDWGGIGGGQNSTYEAWTFEPVEELPITITSAGYATFYSPVAVKLPDGLKAYYVSSTENGKAQMTDIVKVIPANTGVILQGAEGPYNLTIAGEAESVTNKLSGTVASEYISTPSYVLSAQGNPAVVGFYKAMLNFTVEENGTGTKVTEGGTHFLNNGFKAYLPAPADTPAAVRFFLFDFGGEETGITEIENGNVETENSEVYDLSGRRVLNAKKGIFVVNGKVVVK